MTPFKHCFTCVLFLLFLTGFAQSDTVRFTPEYQLEKGTEAIELLTNDSGSFVLREHRPDQDSFLHFTAFRSDSLAVIWEKQLQRPVDLPDDAVFLEMVDFPDRRVAFFEWYDRKAAQLHAYSIQLLEDYSWEGKAEHLVAFEVESHRNRHFQIRHQTGAAACLLWVSGPLGKEDQEEHGLALINAAQQVIWQKRLALPYGDEVHQIHQVVTDPSGNCHLLTGARRKKARDSSNPAERNKAHVLFSYYWEANRLTELEVSLKRRWVSEIKMGITPNGLLALSGFYSNGPFYGTEGIFNFMLEPGERRIVARGLIPLDRDFKALFLTNRALSRGKELTDLFLDGLHYTEDTAVVFIGQHFNISERITNDPTTGRQVIQYLYKYNDLLVARMNKTGYLDWAVKVPKGQTIAYNQEAYSGFCWTPRSKAITLYFNDHEDNARLESPHVNKHLVSLNKAVIARVDITDDGFVSRKHIAPQQRQNTILRPDLHLSLPGYGHVLFRQYKRTVRFGLNEY